MTDDTAERPATDVPAIVQRPAIIAGLIGAVIALSALAVWPAEYYLFVRHAIAAIAGLLMVFAVLAANTNNRKSDVVALFAAGVVGGFWLLTYGAFSREGNMIADVATAAAVLLLGFLIGPQQKFGTVGITVWFVVGAVVTTIMFTNQLSNQQEYQECLEDTWLHDGEDPVEFCREWMSPPDD